MREPRALARLVRDGRRLVACSRRSVGAACSSSGVDIFERVAAGPAAAVVPRHPRLRRARRRRARDRLRRALLGRATGARGPDRRRSSAGAVGVVLSGGVAAAARASSLAAAAAVARRARRGSGASWRRIGAVAACSRSSAARRARAARLATSPSTCASSASRPPTARRRRTSQTYSHRELIAYIGLRVWLDHPVLGAGWQSFREEQVYTAVPRRRAPPLPGRAASRRSRRPTASTGSQRLHPGRSPSSGSSGSCSSSRCSAPGSCMGASRSLRAPPFRAQQALVGLLWLLVAMGTWAGRGSARARVRGAVVVRARPRRRGGESGRCLTRSSVAGRRPPAAEPRHASWSIREPLSRWLETEGRAAAGLRVLDVGCGVKPYLPVLRHGRASTSASTSRRPSTPTSSARSSGFRSRTRSFDVVLCIQVLEHVDDPAQADPRAPPRHPARRPRAALDARHAASTTRPRPTTGAGRTRASSDCSRRAASGARLRSRRAPGRAPASGCSLADLRRPRREAPPRRLARARSSTARSTASAGCDRPARAVAARAAARARCSPNYHVVAER